VLVDELDDVHPIIAPIITKIIVLNFNDSGRFVASINLGIDHNIAEPVVIDNSAIIIIGLITLISSLDDECGLWSRGPQTVAIENRIE
jgi:hypothetical protein